MAVVVVVEEEIGMVIGDTQLHVLDIEVFSIETSFYLLHQIDFIQRVGVKLLFFWFHRILRLSPRQLPFCLHSLFTTFHSANTIG